MKPSLGRVAVSAFYPDRNCPVQDMERQCNWHNLTPFSGGVANRLPSRSAQPLAGGAKNSIPYLVKNVK